MKIVESAIAVQTGRSVADRLTLIVGGGWAESAVERGTIDLLIYWIRLLYRRASTKRLAQFLLRTIVWPRSTVAWLQCIDARPDLSRYVCRQLEMLHKIHRPYMSSRFSVLRRLSLLTGHYAFVDSSPLRRGLWSALRGDLSGVPCGSRNGLTLYLRGAINAKEGEYELCLEDGHNQRLSAVTFSIADFGGRYALLIGGLQGAAPGCRDTIRRASAHLGRLPLKQFLGRVAVRMADALGLAEVFAVDDAVHVYRHRRYRRSKQGAIKARYAETWSALGGLPSADGFWELHYGGATHRNADSRRKARIVDAAVAELIHQLRMRS